jgi:hypothetical protein
MEQCSSTADRGWGKALLQVLGRAPLHLLWAGLLKLIMTTPSNKMEPGSTMQCAQRDQDVGRLRVTCEPVEQERPNRLLWSDHHPALVLQMQDLLSLFLHLPAPFPILCVPFPASQRAPGRPSTIAVL